VAFPTDTLYGLGADAFSTEAVNKVFDAKGRPGNMALPILLGSVRDMEQVTTGIPDMAWALVERFWPGPLTLILRKSPQVPAIVTGGRDSVAVRMPDHPVPLGLVAGLGRPITGTSANPSGEPDITNPGELRRLLGGLVDDMVICGPSPAGTASTIVALSETGPSLLRQGALPYPQILEIAQF
jgi:L-threonylcarbamoyladenylate synthase